MKYSIDEIRFEVAAGLGIPEEKVLVRNVEKENGVVKTGISIAPNPDEIDRTLNPVVYLEDLEDKLPGCDTKRISSAIADAIRQNTKVLSESPFTKERILSACRIKVVSVLRNLSILDSCPHRITADFAEIVFMKADIPQEGSGYVRIDNNMLKAFGIEEDELFETARRNTEDDGFIFKPLSDMIAPGLDDGEDPLYVVTNDKCMYGASALAFPEKIEEYKKQIGEDVYILPSSIHEVLLCRKSCSDDAEVLAMMVRDINSTQVAEEDVLTNSVYEVVNGKVVKAA